MDNNADLIINQNPEDNNNVEIGKKIRLGNVTQEMHPMNEDAPEAKVKEQQSGPQRLYIHGMHIQQIKNILEAEPGFYDCFLENKFIDGGENNNKQANCYPLRQASHPPSAKPITATDKSPIRDAKNTNGKGQRQRKRERRVEKDRANVINVTDMPGYMGNLDLDEIVVRIEGASIANQKKPKNKKNNKDINTTIDNSSKMMQRESMEEIDVELILDDSEVGDSGEPPGTDEREIEPPFIRERPDSNSIDDDSTSSEEYHMDTNSARGSNHIRNSASSDGGSDTSGVEKSHSESTSSPPLHISQFDSIYAAKLRSQTRLLQNCWLQFINDFGDNKIV